MKRLLITIGILSMIAGALNASTVISCSGAATSANACYSSNMPSFTTQLDWAAFGTPDALVLHTGVWTANNVSGYTISVDSSGALGTARADNYVSTLVQGFWVAGMPGPYNFSGRFEAPSDSGNVFASPDQYGERLMGLVGDGTQASATMTVSLNQGVSALGFRIDSFANPLFDVTMQLDPGALGTGSLLNTFNFNGLLGGPCASLENLLPCRAMMLHSLASPGSATTCRVLSSLRRTEEDSTWATCSSPLFPSPLP